MKLLLEQNGDTVTIETKSPGHTMCELAEFFRQLALGQGYPESLVLEYLPREEDIAEIISDGFTQKMLDEADLENNVGGID